MYLALYRKYRPRTFDDVISQEHITTTLKNQVANGTAAHAYLFTGSRGTGKTTCAKIMAMAVNCLSPVNGDPCLECERCREIMSGEATDIVEMDAASNNGVDDVRQLRDEVAYTPVSCKYRVYIIDEVHMLSAAAFNALLKTLEEPPAHVKFILATTELHKVPATISSRCQRFEFRRVDIAESAARLAEVAEKESVRLDADAAELISRLSDGGMRDALSLLDRCISADAHITADTVRNCAGVADNKHLFAFARMTAQNDVAGCIRLLGELHRNSKDLALVIDELSGHYRDLMLYKTAPEATELLSALPDDHPEIAEISGLYDLENILRCLTLLQQCADGIGKTKQRKTLAEMCLVKMCTGAAAHEGYAPKTAARVNPQPSIVIKEPPREDIVPKSLEEMSPGERIIAQRTQELIRQTTEKMRTADVGAADEPQGNAPAEKPAAAAETAEHTIPAEEPNETSKQDKSSVSDNASRIVPEARVTEDDGGELLFDLSEPPSAPEPTAPPPWEEAPPDNGFLGDDYPINTEPPDLSDENEASPGDDAVDVPEDGGDKPIDAADASARPEKLTEEQWKEAVSGMDAMYSVMFANSTAELVGGVLEVSTGNKMLLENVRDEELANVGKMISEKLGFPVTLKLRPDDGADSAQVDLSELDLLLNKARQLGIEVQNKNDQNGG